MITGTNGLCGGMNRLIQLFDSCLFVNEAAAPASLISASTWPAVWIEDQSPLSRDVSASAYWSLPPHSSSA